MNDVEKSQTKPTVAMIASLFQVQEPTKKSLILEKNGIDKNKEKENAI